MFVQYTYIIPEHHVALEAAIRNHTGIIAPVLAKLYKAALANVDKVVANPTFFTSHLKTEAVLVGTATDPKTGIFVQLARNQNSERLFLTTGAKWSMEQTNPTQGNIATQIW